MAAVGEPTKVPPNSYLNQFLSRRATTRAQDGGDDQQDAQGVQAVEYTDPDSGHVNTDCEGGRCPGGHLNDDHHDHRQSDDGNVDAIPRSPPRPTPQPPAMLAAGLRWAALDGSTILDNEDGQDQAVMLRRDLDSSSRQNGCSVSPGHHGVRDDGRPRRRSRPQQQQHDLGYMVDEEDMLQPGDRGGVPAKTYSAIAAAYCSARVPQQQQGSTGLVNSPPCRRRRRPESRSSSKLVPPGRQAVYQQRHIANGNNDGRALSVRESSALFWEESESLDAKSVGANGEWGLGIGGARGVAAAGSAAAGGRGGGAASVRRGRDPTVVVGRGPGPGGRGPRVDVRMPAAAARDAGDGGGSRRRRNHPRSALDSPELPLGQALRTVGGLLGGDGTKMSAVRCFWGSRSGRMD